MQITLRVKFNYVCKYYCNRINVMYYRYYGRRFTPHNDDNNNTYTCGHVR